MASKVQAGVSTKSSPKSSGRYAKGIRGAKALALARSLASAEEQVVALKCAVDQLRDENNALTAKCAVVDAALKVTADQTRIAADQMKTTVDQMQQQNSDLMAKCEALQLKQQIKVDRMEQENSQLKAKCLDNFQKNTIQKITERHLQQQNHDLKAKCEALQLKYAALVAKRVASVPLTWCDEC